MIATFLLLGCVINSELHDSLLVQIASTDQDDDGYRGDGVGEEDCDDEDPGVHPDAEESWANGVTDNDCDGEREEVRVAFGAEVLSGESAGANAGRRLGKLGDVTGDGLAEILVSAVTDSTTVADGGAVYLVS